MLSLSLLALPALAMAQSFDFGVINAQPAAVAQSAPASGQASDAPALQPLSAIPQIASYIVASNPIAQRDVATEDLVKRDGNCAPQPAGTGPSVH